MRKFNRNRLFDPVRKMRHSTTRLKIVLQIIFIGVVMLGLIATKSNAATLTLRLIDKSTGKTVPARVLLRATDGKCYFPQDAVLLKIGHDVWFMSSGESRFEVPPGKAMLRVERGKEYERIKEHLNIPTGDSLAKTVVLERWIDMRQLGYESGENHLHRSPEEIAALCAAEDLNYGTVLQWWKRPYFDVSEGGGHIRNLEFAGIKIPTTVYDVEEEESWGALYMIGMPNPFPFSNDPAMPNLLAAKYGHERGTLNCYQAGWSREVLIDALLGLVDVVNVCNNNFHLHRFQPRSFYSNLLNVPGFPIYPDTPEGMMNLNMETYYRLLNCGLKLAAGAGSATGVKEVPVGYNRAYVRNETPGDINSFLQAWKQGRNFVTNGPMLFLRTSEGLQPGDSLVFSGEREIGLNEEVISDSPILSVEIVMNGEVVKSFPVEKNQKRFRGTVMLTIERSAWLCARCTDTDMLLSDEELAAYEGPPKKYTQKPCRLRFAHTSPIYFKVDGKEIAVAKSIAEGLKMIDAFEKFAQENASEKYKKEILSAVEKARMILRQKRDSVFK